MKRLAGFDCSRGTKLDERRQVLSQEERGGNTAKEGKEGKGRGEVERKVKRVDDQASQKNAHFSVQDT